MADDRAGTLIDQARAAAERAKQAGGNRVMAAVDAGFYPPPPSETATSHVVQVLEAERLRVGDLIRRVRDEMLADGYHRPNAWILMLDDALGEDHEEQEDARRLEAQAKDPDA